ncbi:YhcH/YjgK/YiaL family protein [uncultured Helicobacter sp.]|uniref:YhcH/YjgK/YiaL family protein n=1 Tax=uncultured Helicobacter sp. TaxID=175537 RepID=UPI0037536E95
MAIIGHLEQFGEFFARHPALAEVREYLTQALTIDSALHRRIIALQSSAESERVEISYDLGSGVRAIEQTYPLKPRAQAFYESHRAFVDFQLCVAGAECFEVGHIADFTPLAPYDESKDLIIYHAPTMPPHRLFFHSGILGVFFPQDVHAGGLEYEGDCEHAPLFAPKKVVLKVPVGLL